jgi:anti-anti-sigma factor
MGFEDANELNRLIEAGLGKPERGVVVDFSNTKYMSSTGISSLFLLQEHFSELTGKICLCGVKPHVMHVLRLAGIAHCCPDIK